MSILELAPWSEFAHFAVHGRFNALSLGTSSIPDPDSKQTAEFEWTDVEIADQILHNKHVFLSACETADGMLCCYVVVVVVVVVR